MTQLDRQQLDVISQRAVLVVVALPSGYVDERDPFGEIRALAQTAGAVVAAEMLQRRQHPSGRTYIGKGKVEELRQLIETTNANLVIFDNDLAPAQIRSLEEELKTMVIDRSELILDIFANRATTAAAKLQVEIAQLEYTYPRLRAMWTHLEQVVGGAPVGIGTRGPGEKQLETDRRLVQRRLKQLRHELEEVQARKTREVAERNQHHFTVGLVGYTNAGKSTLFNRLTAGGAFADPKLFATLGTRIEQWNLGGGNTCLLSDTVGFIRNLPHHLVASFRSTLEETVYASLLIIVLDCADPNAPMQYDTVCSTLNEIGARDQPRILVLNKIDQVSRSGELMVWLHRSPEAVPVSAATGEGLDDLRRRVLDQMLGDIREVRLTAPIADGRTIDFIEKRAQVMDRSYDDGEVTLTARLGRRHVDQLLAQGAKFRIDGLPAKEGLKRAWNLPDPPPRAIPIPPHEKWYTEQESQQPGSDQQQRELRRGA